MPTAYSPEKRTALVFCGSGAHGAYHAGALRALQEAGVKIDVVAGHGVGAGAAALAAIDGGASLWDAGGIWRSDATPRFYPFKWALRAAGWLTVLLLGLLITPLLLLGVGLVIYPLGFLLEMIGTAAGAALMGWYSQELQVAFTGDNLPTLVPRLAMMVLAAIVITLASGVGLARWRAPLSRRHRGSWWWYVAGAPFTSAPLRDAVAGTVWRLIRGGAPETPPASTLLGRRYAEVLSENLGQPGFRELLVLATDLDARRDVVAALLRDRYRQDFFARRPGRERRAEVLDLAGTGRDHAMDIVAGALVPPVGCDPHLIAFAGDSFWRGETHRLSDRPASVTRLLEELADAGVSQAIIVSAVAPTGAPHRLSPPRLDLRSRLGEMLEAAEAAALRDAVETTRVRFDAIYLSCPSHNPIGPFDFEGAYDEASDRHQTLTELMELGYEDAYHQFIEPVVGASGEHLADG